MFKRITFVILLVLMSLNLLLAQDFVTEIDGTGNKVLVKYNGISKYLVIPDGITVIGYEAFAWRSSLESIVIPESVFSIEERVFIGCFSLEEIKVSQANPRYTSVEGVLFDKKEKTIIAFPSGKSNKIYSIPEGVTSIGGWAFTLSESLESIVIPESVTTIGETAFVGCSVLEEIRVSQNNSIYASLQGVLFDKKQKSLFAYPRGKSVQKYSIPKGIISIGEGAFYDCFSLISITIPQSVTMIGSWAFESCKSLESIFIPDKVSAIKEGAFLYCSSLENIIIPDSVTLIEDWAFAECDSLKTITIPDSVTYIGDGVFSGCDSLKEIKVNENSYAFSYFLGTEYEKYLSYTPSWLTN